jgi:hypothetical protein
LSVVASVCPITGWLSRQRDALQACCRGTTRCRSVAAATGQVQPYMGYACGLSFMRA